MPKEYMRLEHTNAPVWNEKCKTIILGTFPSVKSRETGFYYGHPQNRFWRVLAFVLNRPLPESVKDKKELLLSNNIALWDVIARCDIAGSSDRSIKNVEPNDVGKIIKNSDVSRVFVNGSEAERLYNKYLLENLKIPAVRLPSTSPANASFSFERLCEEWKKIADY